MILAQVIWDFTTILLVLLLIGGGLFWVIFAWRFENSIEEGVDALLNPLSKLPNEITVEIVKEKQVASQTAPSAPHGKAQASGSISSSHPTEKEESSPE